MYIYITMLFLQPTIPELSHIERNYIIYSFPFPYQAELNSPLNNVSISVQILMSAAKPK